MYLSANMLIPPGFSIPRCATCAYGYALSCSFGFFRAGMLIIQRINVLPDVDKLYPYFTLLDRCSA